MIRSSSMATSRFVQRSALVALSGGTTYLIYASDPRNRETFLGFRRQAYFWGHIGPIVFDYYWQTSSSSPWVKYQNWRSTSDDAAWKARQRLIAQALHEKHAPEMLDVMLKLKGLYVKLGQVMSVTVLPVPESYRVRFRTLQSDVPGWESFESSVKPVLEQELKQSVDHIFEFIEPTPAGAASIGQAHRARLVSNVVSANDNRDVIIKVQYPDASWQVPADIQCVGDFLKVCVWFGVVDESALKLSFDEFSRQFLGELDYEQERSNLEQVYQSSLDLSAPYKKHHVLIPKVYNHLCTKKIITMTYLPGPKLEAEAKRQLAALGIDTSKYKLSDIVKTAASEASQKHNHSGELVRRVTKRVDPKHSPFLSQLTTRVGVDTLLWTVRLTRRLILWSQALAVSSLESLPRSWIPSNWSEWANDHRFAAAQAKQLNLTKKWMDALFDVHGHQIFNLGLFNGDPHPGNILVIEEEGSNEPSPKLGLIDYGQCKCLTSKEQVRIAQLILSVANNECDENVANAFRNLGITTKNDSTEFLSSMARLMFGPLLPQHMNPKFHRSLHESDKIIYFPKELSMVYRTALLLRGLAISLQLNYSVGAQWKHHAQEAVERHPEWVMDTKTRRPVSAGVSDSTQPLLSPPGPAPRLR